MKRLSVIASILFVANTSLSAPSGFSSKDAALQFLNDNQMLVQSGKHAVIQWDSFSLSKDDLIRFLQQDEKSFVVNRVMGSAKSEIFGQILSNGSVCLINPQGVLIGPTGKIEVGGFIASTLDWMDDSHFQGDSKASVVNMGTIRCENGDVFLIGNSVEDLGTIDAQKVALLAGSDVVIASDGFTIHNAERIDAETFEENPYAMAIRCSGGIKAADIYLLGESIHLQEGADLEGKRILVGGDYKGQNKAIPNAKRTWVEKQASVVAEEKAIIWSDEDTQFLGTIGGKFMEVSGGRLKFHGKVEGQEGKLLLDPSNVTIESGMSTQMAVCGLNGPATDDTVFDADEISALLDAGGSNCSVEITTINGGGTQNGSIIVNAPILWTGNTTFGLDADSFIELNASITNTVGGMTGVASIDLSAAGTNTGTFSGITLNSGVVVATDAGDISITGSADGTATNGVFFNGGVVNTAAGNVVVVGEVLGGATGTCSGILLNSMNSIVSSGGGSIRLSGTSQSMGDSSHGVSIVAPWNTSATSGDVIFSNCAGGSGANCNGVDLSATLQVAGNLLQQIIFYQEPVLLQ